MKKQKGFTLIELLAVIVILAVIALIATPIVIGIIEDSRKKAAETSMHGIIDAANFYAAGQGLKQEPIESPIDLTGNTLSYQGKKPEKGVLIFNTEQDIQATAYLNGYCLQKNFGDEKVYFIDATKEQCGSTYSIEGMITFVYGSEYAGRENYKDAPTVKLIQNGVIVKTVKLNFDDITINAMNSTVNYKIDSIPYGTYDIEFSMLYHMPYTYKNYTIDHNFEGLNGRIFKGDFDCDGMVSSIDAQRILDFSNGKYTCPSDIEHCIPYFDLDGSNSISVADHSIANNRLNAVEVYNKNITFKGKTNIPNTKIILKRNMEDSLETISDTEGNFSFENISAGTYRISVTNGWNYTTYDNMIIIPENETDITIEQFWAGSSSPYVTAADVKNYYNTILDWADSPYDANYDVNKDGSINLEDYEFMKKNLFGKQTVFNRPIYTSSKEDTELIIETVSNSVINLNCIGMNSYNVQLDDSGRISLKVKKGTYFISAHKMYWAITQNVSLTSITSPTTISFDFKYGDFTLDKIINNSDVIKLNKEITKYNADPTTANVALYDMNGDGILNGSDVAILKENMTA